MDLLTRFIAWCQRPDMIKLRTFNPHISMVHLVRGAKAGAVSGVIYGAVNAPIINIGINLISGQLGNWIAGIMTDGLWLLAAILMNSVIGVIAGSIFGLIFVVLYDRLPGTTPTDKGIVMSIIHWAAIPLGLSVRLYMFFSNARIWRPIVIGLGTSILWGWLLGHFWESGRPGPRPGKIKTRMFNPIYVSVIAFSIILISLNVAQSWRLFPTTVPQTQPLTPESIETLTISTDTILTEDHVGNIVIGADNVTLDGNGHGIIGPSPDIFICDPNTGDVSWTIGILLEGRTGVTIKNCSVTGFGYGFFLNDSDRNILQGNIANDNAFIGFVLSYSSDNTLRDNTVSGNGDDPGNGFELCTSFRNTFQGNTANDNSNGFTFDDSDGNILRGNTANNNTISGFMVGYSSNNTLTDNTVSNNANGIWGGSNNRIYHNNFVNNIQQVNIEKLVNTWDDGSGGNYWSDYTGVDADGDGIGDTPYVIDEDNVDRFPLIAPISVFDTGMEGGEMN
jgi:parallel beta-helix repeat protein